MKPLKLKINAFGPYANLEEIDFQKLDNIYLITGATGAGKTTIFDAISFALFGETSGKERDVKELKSDFSGESEISFVELEFLLHGNVYKIKREPSQMIKGRKTRRNSSIEFHVSDHKVITKIDEANKKVEELLGLNAEQFRQIVMLPQGEFKKLIEASTSEKEIIFRKIFSTNIYNDFQERLKLKASLMKKDLEKHIDRRNTLIKKIESGENEDLKILLESENINTKEIIEKSSYQIEVDKEKLEKLQNLRNIKSNELEELTKAIEKSKEINIKIENLSLLIKKLDGLLEKEDSIKKSEECISNAIKAKEVIIFEKNLKECETTSIKKQEEVVKSKESIKVLKENLEVKKTNLKNQEKREDEKKLLEKNINELSLRLEVVKEYEENIKDLNVEESLLKKAENNLNNIIKERENNALYLKEIEEFLKEKESLEVDILTLEGLYKENEDNIKLLRSFYSKIEDFKKDINLHKTLSEDYNKISKLYLEKANIFEEKNELLKKEQAGVLASLLEEGKPCIVCGSTHHPNKAIKSEALVSEDEIKLLQKDLDNIKLEKEDSLQKVSSISGKIEEMRNGSIKEGFEKFLNINSFSIEDIDDLQNKIKNKGKELALIIKSYSNDLVVKKKDLELKNNKKEEKEKVSFSLEKIDSNIKVLEEDVKKVFGKCEALKSVILNLEKTFNNKILSFKDIKENIDAIKQNILKIEKDILIARNEEKEATMNLTSEIKNLENKEVESKEAIVNEENKKKEFENVLNKYDFTYKLYKESILEDSEIKKIESEINTYKEEVLKYKQEIKILKEETKNKEKTDTSLIEDEKNKIKKDVLELEEEEKILYSKVNNNLKILNSVNELSGEIGSKEEEYSIVSELSNIANGNNSKKITFERHVLTYHFNEILEAANIRFKIMTNERYYLERKIEITDGRRGQGLDFDVYDNYTGKTRSIKSLSGGESFKAALALSLGLSDVIQSSSGGVRIDAMFIDEGFGTLDPESLEKAIETLLELGSGGKTVGVISHVPELRERISSKIEIGKSKKGSCIKVIEEY